MNEHLIKGAAYHGNRMLTHVREDMRELAVSGFNAVLHMFSHNDWDRHRTIMKEIFSISADYGLDVWVDNWGLGGPPGDKSHFLAYHPEAHQVNADGTMSPVHVCFNAPAYVQFTKDWIDAIREAGAKKIFWDEPRFIDHTARGPMNWTCRCENCRRLFAEKYGHEMPAILTDEVDAFRKWSISNYFQTVASYAKSLGMYNSICVMFSEGENPPNYGTDLESISSTPALDNIGSDPYWLGAGPEGYAEVYKFVYERSKRNLDLCARHGKDHNLWIQTYSNPVGREEEIIAAADAIYDSGARTIFCWGFRGSDANDYRAAAPDRTWYATKAAYERITQRHRDELWRKVREEMAGKTSF